MTKVSELTDLLARHIDAVDTLKKIAAEHPEITEQFCKAFLSDIKRETECDKPMPHPSRNGHFQKSPRLEEIRLFLADNGPSTANRITDEVEPNASKDVRRKVYRSLQNQKCAGKLSTSRKNGKTLYDLA
jgi:hypothetical protein